MNAIRAGLACSLVSLLAACGGGGGDSGSPAVTSTGTGATSSYPTSRPSAGDWYSYTQTTQVTSPSASTSVRHFTRYYSESNGSLSYVETSADPSAGSGTSVLDGSLAFISEGDCTYTPALRTLPPLGTAAGTSYSTTVTRTCPHAIAAQRTATVNVAGKADGSESRTIALGAFGTFKSSRTVNTVMPTESQKTASTCWDDVRMGVMVECLREFSSTSAGATATVLASNTSRTELIAYGRNVAESSGPTVRRFAGGWTVRFTGDDSGGCDNVRVGLDGAISGSCTFGTTYPISGQITGNGDVTVNVSNGAVLTGGARSPVGASGTWKLGNLVGNWTASHR